MSLEQDLLAVFNNLKGDAPPVGYITLYGGNVYEVEPERHCVPRTIGKVRGPERLDLPHFFVKRVGPDSYQCVGASGLPAAKDRLVTLKRFH